MTVVECFIVIAYKDNQLNSVFVEVERNRKLNCTPTLYALPTEEPSPYGYSAAIF
jgi:hypothetical protein